MQDFRVIGNIGSDLVLQETSNGVSMLRFSTAVSRNYTRADGERDTDWFDCYAYRGTAESIAKYCKKGDKIYLQGKIETHSYEDSQGIKRKAYDFVIEKTEFLGVKKERNEAADQTEKPTKRQKATLQDMDDDDEQPPF